MKHSSPQNSSDNKDQKKARKILKLFGTNQALSRNEKLETDETEEAIRGERASQ